MKQNKKNILVIAPHADDEVLGCGGYILDMTSQGHEVDVVIMCLGGFTPYSQKQQENAVNRLTELDGCCKMLGASWEVLFHGRESLMDTVDKAVITSKLDEVLDRKDYDEVFIPYPSHHQDHKICYEQSMAALRQKPNKIAPRIVALYEYTFVQEIPKGGFWYHDITDWVEFKCLAFERYVSQTKDFPSPLNRNAIYALAAMRGMQAECKFAERFYLQTMRS